MGPEICSAFYYHFICMHLYLYLHPHLSPLLYILFPTHTTFLLLSATIHSFFQSYIHVFIHLFIHSFIHPLSCSFPCLFMDRFFLSVIHSCIYLFIHLFIHPLSCSCSFLPMFVCLFMDRLRVISHPLRMFLHDLCGTHRADLQCLSRLRSGWLIRRLVGW